MASYVVMGSYTDQGIKDIKSLTQRLEAAKQALQAAGGRMIFWYLTLGEYDFVTVAEVPDPASGAGVLLALGAQGDVRTTTMQAFTEDEAAAIVASLP